MRVKIDAPQIVHEAIDGEVVVVNFKNGRYYSLEHVAAEVWDAIARGTSVPVIIERLTHRYEADPDEIARRVNEFVNILLKEGLVVSSNGVAEEPAAVRPDLVTGTRRPFQPPVAVLYNDMEGLLLIDPVHNAEDP
jgi:hypothetical protein